MCLPTKNSVKIVKKIVYKSSFAEDKRRSKPILLSFLQWACKMRSNWSDSVKWQEESQVFPAETLETKDGYNFNLSIHYKSQKIHNLFIEKFPVLKNTSSHKNETKTFPKTQRPESLCCPRIKFWFRINLSLTPKSIKVYDTKTEKIHQLIIKLTLLQIMLRVFMCTNY